MSKKTLLILALAASATVAGAFALVAYSAPTALSDEAERIVALCADAPDRMLCYDKEIPRLMEGGISMEDAFVVTSIVQDLDRSFVYCHVLGHILAEKETAKDPDKWLQVVHRVPSGICSNGGIHGAFQERFRTESFPDARLEELKPILAGACKAAEGWNPTRMEQATCTHALGHLTMYITDADIDKSLAVCDAVALNEEGYDFRQLCYDGAFMQIYQPLEPEDFDLIAGKEITRETRDAFCARFSGQAHDSCISESWPMYRLELEEPQGTVAFCSALPTDDSRGRCYRGIFYVLTALFRFDEERIAEFCGGLPEDLSGFCFANAASRIVETDWRNIERSAALCARADVSGVGEVCFDELIRFSTYNFHPGSREALALCAVLSSPYDEQCFLRQ